ncbi:MAG TPA: IS1380 family transposase [Gammaproteobacteria bacterium]|nr:IS1380 family transposase [Gammaproteobacteria bacterium]
MKRSKACVLGRARAGMEVRFEEQDLTSFSGLVIFQGLFARLRLKERLWRCFRHRDDRFIYADHLIVLMLIVHLLLGFRELRDTQYYREDEMVKRLLGLKHLPEVSTISRALACADGKSVVNLRAENRGLVLERLQALRLSRVTVDFDGSVQSTSRHAEGTAVGFNKKKKGARSYYPLFCTIAQTGQVFDVYHRPGNVHDSNGAKAFISACLEAIRAALPGVKLEVRIDSAFFSEDIVKALKAARAEFTISVPFERLTELKGMIEQRQRWRRLDGETSYFEADWKPKSWSKRYRFVFIRKRVKRQHKAPIQLDLFIPHEQGQEFKVIVSSKRQRAKHVVIFHEGRGSQEGIFAELKSHCHMDYVPVTTLHGNQIYLLAGMLAHNLGRELQMIAYPPQRKITPKRTALWAFEKLGTLQRKLIQRAGRLLRPAGKLVLSMTSNEIVETELLHYLEALDVAP